MSILTAIIADFNKCLDLCISEKQLNLMQSMTSNTALSCLGTQLKATQLSSWLPDLNSLPVGRCLTVWAGTFPQPLAATPTGKQYEFAQLGWSRTPDNHTRHASAAVAKPQISLEASFPYLRDLHCKNSSSNVSWDTDHFPRRRILL